MSRFRALVVRFLRRIPGRLLLWLDVYFLRCRYHQFCNFAEGVWGPLTPAEVARERAKAASDD